MKKILLSMCSVVLCASIGHAKFQSPDQIKEFIFSAGSNPQKPAWVDEQNGRCKSGALIKESANVCAEMIFNMQSEKEKGIVKAYPLPEKHNPLSDANLNYVFFREICRSLFSSKTNTDYQSLANMSYDATIKDLNKAACETETKGLLQDKAKSINDSLLYAQGFNLKAIITEALRSELYVKASQNKPLNAVKTEEKLNVLSQKTFADNSEKKQAKEEGKYYYIKDYPYNTGFLAEPLLPQAHSYNGSSFESIKFCAIIPITDGINTDTVKRKLGIDIQTSNFIFSVQSLQDHNGEEEVAFKPQWTFFKNTPINEQYWWKSLVGCKTCSIDSSGAETLIDHGNTEVVIHDYAISCDTHHLGFTGNDNKSRAILYYVTYSNGTPGTPAAELNGKSLMGLIMLYSYEDLAEWEKLAVQGENFLDVLKKAPLLKDNSDLLSIFGLKIDPKEKK